MAFFERGLNLASPDTAKDLMAQRGQRQEGRLSSWQNMWGQFGQTMAAKGEAKRQREFQGEQAEEERGLKRELTKYEWENEIQSERARFKQETDIEQARIDAAFNELQESLESEETLTRESFTNAMKLLTERLLSEETRFGMEQAKTDQRLQDERDWREKVQFPQDKEIAEIHSRAAAADATDQEKMLGELWENINAAATGLDLRDPVTGNVKHAVLSTDKKLAVRFRDAFLEQIKDNPNAGQLQGMFNTYYSTYWEGTGAGEGPPKGPLAADYPISAPGTAQARHRIEQGVPEGVTAVEEELYMGLLEFLAGGAGDISDINTAQMGQRKLEREGELSAREMSLLNQLLQEL